MSKKEQISGIFNCLVFLVLLLIILLVGCSKKDEFKHNSTYNFHKEAIVYINNAYNFEATDKYLRDVFVESYIKTEVVEYGVNFDVYIVLNIKNALTTDKRTFHLKGYNDSQGNHFTEIKEVGGVSVLQTFNFKYTNKIDKEWKQNND